MHLFQKTTVQSSSEQVNSTENCTLTKYLNNFVNCSENLSDLLQIFIDLTQSRSAVLFILVDSSKYKCLGHINIDQVITMEAQFTCSEPIDNILINVNSIFTLTLPYEVVNSMIIPITLLNRTLGIICLLNRTQDYYEELINTLTPYLSLLQLILDKYVSNKSYSKVYHLDEKELFFS